MNIGEDFRKFALANTAAKRSVLDSGEIKNMLTPVVLEERELKATSVDVFSRLLMDRIIYFTGEVNAETCDVINAELLYLDSVDNRDINLYINSPGGSVVDGLSTIDTMNFISSNVSTISMGMAASMGAVLLSNGTKGKRFALPHSRIMIHSVSSGFNGHSADVRIEMEQMERAEQDVYNILSANTGKSYEEIKGLCDRDKWYIGAEAVELGIVDKIVDKTN